MKLAVIFLCLLGIAAAACAAFLINGLNPVTSIKVAAGIAKPDTNAPADAPVDVLYATRSIGAMTVVDGGMVVIRAMPANAAPAGYLASPVDVVGRVISKPLVAGQPFTKECFGEMSGARQLAGVIPPGKRAVGISVTDYAGLDGLIYPGSVVDVMVTFRADGSDARGPLTTTLLEDVQVLAFDTQTVVSPGRVIGDFDHVQSGAARHVTLLVDTKQSKALELAMQQGTLSLALRNPLDSAQVDKQVVSFRSIMGEPDAVRATTPAGPDAASETTTQGGAGDTNPGPTTHPKGQAHWDTIVIRGEKSETVSFPLPKPSKDRDAENKTPAPLPSGPLSSN